MIESKYETTYDGSYKITSETKLIGFGEEKTRVTGLQANACNMGYKAPSFGLNSKLQAINISEGGFRETAKVKFQGLPIKSTLSNGSLDFSTGGGAILTGKIFLNIKY